MKIQAWVPKGGGHIGLPKPYPLAVFTSGFLLAGAQYASYAERLTSWGYCCITYDLTQQALDPLTDVVCVALLRDLLDWARTSAPLGALCDTHAVLLAGHSRGAKVSALAAAQDDRVRALFLIDPVDNTPYAPLGPGFPSAAAALAAPRPGRAPLPVAVVGSELGADCAPEGANYSRFYDAAQAPALEAVVRGAGHLQVSAWLPLACTVAARQHQPSRAWQAPAPCSLAACSLPRRD
jgi:pimeloyl-ACP methyl ester carboxylesterase